MKRFISIMLAVLILIFSFSGCNSKRTATYSNKELTVYFFDVGQADCSFLVFPDGTTMLIDAGNKADGEKISEVLEDWGFSAIDYFVLTHPHEDHIGGAESIFDDFEISNVCLPNILEDYLPDTAIFKDLMSSIEAEKCRTLNLNAGTNIIQKENFSVTAISPATDSVFSDMNNWSLVLSVNCFTNRILFMGDAEAPVEQDILENGYPVDTDILKVGHHGSSGSSSEKFLQKATPLVSVISSGKGNTYNHPHQEALTRLDGIKSTIYRTDTAGTIIAKCYDGGFNIETDSSIMLDGNR